MEHRAFQGGKAPCPGDNQEKEGMVRGKIRDELWRQVPLIMTARRSAGFLFYIDGEEA